MPYCTTPFRAALVRQGSSSDDLTAHRAWFASAWAHSYRLMKRVDQICICCAAVRAGYFTALSRGSALLFLAPVVIALLVQNDWASKAHPRIVHELVLETDYALILPCHALSGSWWGRAGKRVQWEVPATGAGSGPEPKGCNPSLSTP